ncbi:RNA polymerase sigma factor [Paenibacillus sp. J2TS4]|uniref:RNA polymerase sigma factor n=1 Tax=Paenibacillus sp. J2TS4 TaxID=2807194 RepID=UPI001B261ADA|nr:sigma-70 family RNA polymerase sigma factor [Paenibacillus sp. J2TS4]GIP32494.1 DNA-directed RNA polymerase sigma-70 factor [Paenibacillus sp. J2TS4]
MYDHIKQMYLVYYHELYRFVAKLCRDPDQVDDIIQNTFLEAIKSMETFKSHSSLKTWLFGIAKHQLYRQFRKNKIQLDLDALAEAELATQSDFSDKLLAEQILDAINGLDPPHNEIMRLRLIDGLSFKEIGMRVGKTENYCRVNFFRTKDKLRKEFAYEHM